MNTFRTMGSVASNEEHMCRDVIGDYSRLGKCSNDLNLKYKF